MNDSRARVAAERYPWPDHFGTREAAGWNAAFEVIDAILAASEDTGAGLPLTAEEVRALRPGVAVEVIWSGGNGPHHYIIREFAGELFAGDHRHDNPLTGPGTFVGQEHFHTRVWRLVRA